MGSDDQNAFETRTNPLRTKIQSILVSKAEQVIDVHINHSSLPISRIRKLDRVGVTARSVIRFVNVDFMVTVLIKGLQG
jgi:hypothetical protein